MKAQGFTLIELLFCMALIGLVLSFGGWVYQVFHGFQYRYLAQVEKTYESIHLEDRLQKDFAHAEAIASLGIDCFQLLDGDKQEKVRYCLTENLLIRSHHIYQDTFKLHARWNLSETSLHIQDLDTELSYSFNLTPRSRAKKLTINANQP